MPELGGPAVLMLAGLDRLVVLLRLGPASNAAVSRETCDVPGAGLLAVADVDNEGEASGALPASAALADVAVAGGVAVTFAEEPAAEVSGRGVVCLLAVEDVRARGVTRAATVPVVPPPRADVTLPRKEGAVLRGKTGGGGLATVGRGVVEAVAAVDRRDAVLAVDSWRARLAAVEGTMGARGVGVPFVDADGSLGAADRTLAGGVADADAAETAGLLAGVDRKADARTGAGSLGTGASSSSSGTSISAASSFMHHGSMLSKPWAERIPIHLRLMYFATSRFASLTST